MIKSQLLLSLLLGALAFSAAVAQENATQNAPAAKAGDVSGTYTFLRDGEFLQLTVDDGRLSGYISRFGDSESDKGQFINQFFDKAALQGNRLSFTTRRVHGLWYDFNGAITTAPAKQPSEEGYRLIDGTLVEHTTDAEGREKSRQRSVAFHSFPEGVSKR